jgi:hypothetical protein
MNKLRIFQVLLLCAPLLRGQASLPAAPPDSGRRDRIFLEDPGIATGKPTFFIPPRFINDLTIVLPSYVDDAGYPGASRFSVDPKLDLLSPLRLQRERDSGTLRSILGSIQFVGVAFLAVRSLQKNDAKPPLPRQIRTNKP